MKRWLLRKLGLVEAHKVLPMLREMQKNREAIQRTIAELEALYEEIQADNNKK